MWYRTAFEFADGWTTEIKNEKEKGGYLLREMEVSNPQDPKSPAVELDGAYSLKDGCYIGDEKTAKMLAKKGIVPELADQGDSVCSIGYCEKEKKWYGWSHRAMHGFGIGDTGEEWMPTGDKKGKKKAKTLEDAKEMAKAFAESVS